MNSHKKFHVVSACAIEYVPFHIKAVLAVFFFFASSTSGILFQKYATYFGVFGTFQKIFLTYVTPTQNIAYSSFRDTYIFFTVEDVSCTDKVVKFHGYGLLPTD